MLKRFERRVRVYAPAVDGGEVLGEYPVTMSYRTSEEVEENDLWYTNVRFTVYAERHNSPAGGYRRGMFLESEDGRERYRVLVPVEAGRMWLMKAERVMTDGEG